MTGKIKNKLGNLTIHFIIASLENDHGNCWRNRHEN